jgi:uncharacterized protein (TIGR02271 family)
MFVMGTQGERIGKVIQCDNPETFVVEKGVFFPKDYELRYDHIADIAGGTIRYALTDYLRGRNLEETTRSAAPAPAPAAAKAEGATAAAAAKASAAAAVPISAARRGEARADIREAKDIREAQDVRDAKDTRDANETREAKDTRDEVRIPLMREEIGIEKVARESGHVRIHKTIHTEEKHFTVPVTREEVLIEHVAVGRDAPMSADASFQEDTVDVPLYEEEVRVSKRPYMEEEVVVRTVARSVEREGTATLRHEEAEVEDTRKATGSSASSEAYTDTDPDVRR